jgi:hypothetical protein
MKKILDSAYAFFLRTQLLREAYGRSLLALRCSLLNFRHSSLNFTYPLLKFRYSLLNFRSSPLNFWNSLLIFRNLLLNIRYSFLAFRHSLLNVRNSLLRIRSSLLNFRSEFLHIRRECPRRGSLMSRIGGIAYDAAWMWISTRRLSCRPSGVSFDTFGRGLSVPQRAQVRRGDALVDQVVAHRAGALVGESLVVDTGPNVVGVPFHADVLVGVALEVARQLAQRVTRLRPQRGGVEVEKDVIGQADSCLITHVPCLGGRPTGARQRPTHSRVRAARRAG